MLEFIPCLETHSASSFSVGFAHCGLIIESERLKHVQRRQRENEAVQLVETNGSHISDKCGPTFEEHIGKSNNVGCG